MAFSPVLILAGALLLADAHFQSMNVVDDAKRQENKLLRCWEPIEAGNPSAGHKLSNPVHSLCSYMPDAHDFSKFYVNGVHDTADDYSAIKAVFVDTMEGYAVLNVCLQEGFAFFGPGRSAQVSMRCMCKRDGCNIPKTITEFLNFNKNPIPELHQ